MEQHIISPWTVYLIGMSNNMVIISTITLVMGLLITILIGGIYLVCDDEEVCANIRKAFKKTHIATILITCTIVCVFVPDKTTWIQMIVANNLTYANINKSISAGISVKDSIKKDIIEILTAINKERGE